MMTSATSSGDSGTPVDGLQLSYDPKQYDLDVICSQPTSDHDDGTSNSDKDEGQIQDGDCVEVESEIEGDDGTEIVTPNYDSNAASSILATRFTKAAEVRDI